MANDDYALHLQAVVQKLKLRIPSDIAILGVDDESDNLSSPGISSIQLDFRKAGNLAAELCGYRTFNAFRDAFKAQTGLTPRDWRKRG